MGQMILGFFIYYSQSLLPYNGPSSYLPYFIYLSLLCCIYGSSSSTLTSNCFMKPAWTSLMHLSIIESWVIHPHSNQHMMYWRTCSNGTRKFTPYWIQQHISSMLSLMKQPSGSFSSLHAPFCGDISSWCPHTGYYFGEKSSTGMW